MSGVESLSLMRRINQLPLAWKTLLFTCVIGVAVWAVLDAWQSQRLRVILENQINDIAAQRAVNGRAAFDRHLVAQRQNLELIVAHRAMQKHLPVFRQEWQKPAAEPLMHRRPPPRGCPIRRRCMPWFPCATCCCWTPPVIPARSITVPGKRRRRL
ncbi:MAG: hypothetical protein H7831_04325 [Magnetococcus sp. WYHC-3]